MKYLKLIVGGMLLSAFFFLSCNNQDQMIKEGKGHLNVHMTDSPFPIDLISSTLVTFDRVEIRQKIESESDSLATQDSFIVISENQRELNLLDLTNGLTEEIGSVDLNPGFYDLIRIHIVSAKIVLKDGRQFDLKVPSGSTSGLKIKIQPAIYVAEGETANVLLDFDISKSFVAQGNTKGHINGFIFKPTVRGVYMGQAGSIAGNVSDTTGTPLEHAFVKVVSDMNSDYYENEDNNDDDDEKSAFCDNDDNHMMATFTDSDGKYKLLGLNEGTYTLVCSMEGFLNDTIKDVAVVAEETTNINFNLVPVPLETTALNN